MSDIAEGFYGICNHECTKRKEKLQMIHMTGEIIGVNYGKIQSLV